MRKQTLIGIALASAMSLSTLAFAAPFNNAAGPPQGMHHGHHERHGHGHGQMMMLGKLNLSDAQRASVKQILMSGREQSRTQWKALRQQRAAFDSMIPTQAGYQAAATQLAQASGQATQTRVRQQADVRAQIYAVLTPAQQMQLASLKQQRETRHAQWKQFKAEHPVSTEE